VFVANRSIMNGDSKILKIRDMGKYYLYLKLLFKRIMSGFIEFLKGEKYFYKYNKQTILHLLYRILIGCFAFDVCLCIFYLVAKTDKSSLMAILLVVFVVITLAVIASIIWFYYYHINVIKDITPLQSESHSILKELVNKVSGDSGSGLTTEELKSMFLEGGKKQNSKKE